MSITSLDDLVELARKKKTITAIAVVEAHDEHTIESVIDAAKDGIMNPKLIGNEKIIRTMLSDHGADPAGYKVFPTDGIDESLKVAVDMINTGQAGALMKGKIESADYLRAIVSKENGLMEENSRLSVVGFFSPPQYKKLLAVSDPGLNTYPDLEGKKHIVENSVKMLCSLGYDNPKVAILSSVEKLNPKMPDTVDADALKKMYLSGEIKNCIIEGPISLDLAISAESARIKGYDSPVAGDADLLIVPDITAGNLLVKCLTTLAGAQTAGCVLGAKIPAILISRSADAADKYYSIALAACVAAGMIKE